MQHPYIINASIQLVRLVKDKHPYIWIDEAIEIIQHSGLKHEVGAFSTTVEGYYDEIMQLVNEINSYLVEQKCHEWICNVQLQLRAENDMTAEEKVEKYK